ncbi:MAG: hypothetical protein HQ567_28465, partial [Candidatus Nealsonbacteria bacterium]|nr:hypothetical protein [Candidatus Nealsonbacteria bacterium]
AKPDDDAAKPDDDSAKPDDDAAKPDDDDAKPDDDSAKPDDDDAKPDDDAAKPDDTEQPQEETAGDDTPPMDTSPDDGDSSATKRASPLRFVSFLQETDPDSEADDAEPADSEAADAEPADSEVGDAEPAEAEPKAAPSEGEPEVQAPKIDPTAEPDLPPVIPDNGVKKEPEDPLKGPLGEEIRKDIARKKANEKIDEIFASLESEMDAYRFASARYAAKPATAAPKKLDFKKLADKYGLTAGYLKEKSQLEMRESAVATSVFDRKKFLVDHVYDTRRDQLYLPMPSEGYSDNARYLSWKETQTESRDQQQEKKEEDRIALTACYGVPEFDEPGIEKEVLTAWKTEQARLLAVKAAETLAKKAREAGKPLADVFAEHDVKTSDPFTWLTFGNMPAGLSRTPPSVSEVEGVDRAGPDFFRKVLELKAGDVGVAMNYPKTIAYVIRVVEVNPTREKLWSDFTGDVTFQQLVFPQWGLQQTMYEINVALQEELESAAGLKWVRPPDRNRNQ